MSKSLGQYFTKDESLKENLYKFILNNPKEILEPSIGRGDLVEFIQQKIPQIEFDMYEIDKSIKFLDTIDREKIVYGDFLKQEITKKYDTIIGNPPYVKSSKGNLYIDFIEKCFNLLNESGELIFIIPSDFFKLTSACNLINTMMSKGKFTHIYHPHNEKLFENASIDVLIFRYQFFESENKNLDSKIIYNDENMYINNSNGLITFGKTEKTTNFKVEDYFNVYVGLVTGLEEVYKNDTYGNIEVLNAEDKLEKYIFLETFPSKNPEINKLLLENKSKLISRGIRKFNESNWFEWGAPRNIKTIREHMGKDCIYMTNLSRKEKVCFKEKVQYFGGNLLMMLPKQDLDLDKFVEYFNSEKFKSNFIFSGRFKIGQRQLCNYVF